MENDIYLVTKDLKNVTFEFDFNIMVIQSTDRPSMNLVSKSDFFFLNFKTIRSSCKKWGDTSRGFLWMKADWYSFIISFCFSKKKHKFSMHAAINLRLKNNYILIVSFSFFLMLLQILLVRLLNRKWLISCVF